MSARLANIKSGSADVVIDGEVVGWVVRTEYDAVDDDEKPTGRRYYLWDVVEPCKWGGGEVNGMPYRTRREAIAGLLERVR